MEVLPEELPAFLRTAEVAGKVTLLGRELDRSKGSGAIHDRERDPGHDVNLDDDGNVMGGVPLNPLPASRDAYDKALRAKGFTRYQWYSTHFYLLCSVHNTHAPALLPDIGD